MFRIRSSQLDQFGASAQEGFEARMTSYFRQTFSAETERLDVEAWVARNVRRALDHHIEMEPEVAQYLLFCLRLGEDAPEKHSWFDAVLHRRDLASDGKMRAIVETLREKDGSDLDRFVMERFA